MSSYQLHIVYCSSYDDSSQGEFWYDLLGDHIFEGLTAPRWWG